MAFLSKIYVPYMPSWSGRCGTFPFHSVGDGYLPGPCNFIDTKNDSFHAARGILGTVRCFMVLRPPFGNGGRFFLKSSAGCREELMAHSSSISTGPESGSFLIWVKKERAFSEASFFCFVSGLSSTFFVPFFKYHRYVRSINSK